MKQELGRREFLLAGSSLLAVGPVRGKSEQKIEAPPNFRYGLNTGTLRGFQLGLADQIDLTARAGYAGIEPWVADISKYVETGGSLKDLRRRCRDAGLEVFSAIGFAPWIVDDDSQRAKGLEQMKRDMGLVSELGGTRIAAPPAGANRTEIRIDPARMGERYRAILEIGRETGVVPQLEIWGYSSNLSHMAEALAVAARAAHPDACILADVYHLYKGGSDPSSLKLLSRQAAHVFHMNDYPAVPDRQTITDAYRIWPGDGIAPMKQILGHLAANGCRLMLSLELFNTEYWKLPPAEMAGIGLAKMKSAVAAAGRA
jgi:2-keto-myo-inositol isomerase